MYDTYLFRLACVLLITALDLRFPIFLISKCDSKILERAFDSEHEDVSVLASA
jgi:hypothetical protein